MKLTVFNYLDYRQFLRDLATEKRAQSPAFSLEALGRRSGRLTKSHLSLIFAGKRNLTGERIGALSRALGLAGAEERYFRSLVKFNQAKDDHERDIHLSAMATEASRTSGEMLPAAGYGVLAGWWTLAIRELARTSDFDGRPASIAKRLHGRISVKQASEALKTLRDAGLVVDVDGTLKASNTTIRTADEITSLAVRSYHKSCLDLGKRILEDVPVDQREFGSINLLLAQEDKPKLKSLIKTFREQVLALAAAPDQAAARVTQVNVQMFDLSN